MRGEIRIMSETISDKLDKILNKVNSNTGQILSLAQRVKAQEEKAETEIQIENLALDIPNVDTAKFYQWMTEVFPASKEEESEIIEPIEEAADPEEEIDPEVLEKLDQVNGDS